MICSLASLIVFETKKKYMVRNQTRHEYLNLHDIEYFFLLVFTQFYTVTLVAQFSLSLKMRHNRIPTVFAMNCEGFLFVFNVQANLHFHTQLSSFADKLDKNVSIK